MDFELNDEQSMVKELVGSMMGDLVTDTLHARLEAEGVSWSPELWAALAEAEVLGLALPEEHGGGGLGFDVVITLLIEAGKAAAPAPLSDALVAGMAIALYGDDRTQRAWLPKLASGEQTVVLAFDEEGAAEPSKPTVAAERVGDGWHLTGTKNGVREASRADGFLVVAQHAEEAALYLVRSQDAAIEPQLGTDHVNRGRVTLASAPAIRLSGGAGAVNDVLNRAWICQCAELFGLAKAALKLTSTFCQTRKQFDTPIGAFQAVSQRAADAFIDVQSMDVTLWQAAWRLSEGLPADREVQIARFQACEGIHRVTRAAQHLHGGMGFDRDYPLYRYTLRGRALEMSMGGAAACLTRLGHLIPG